MTGRDITGGPTEEELAAVLAALRLRGAVGEDSRAGEPGFARPGRADADDALGRWRRRRLAALGYRPRRPPHVNGWGGTVVDQGWEESSSSRNSWGAIAAPK